MASASSAMPFRSRFDCLWCGAHHATRSAEDLEGWAQLCPTCLGRAGDNPFLRSKLRAAIAARGAADRPAAPTTVAPPASPGPQPGGPAVTDMDRTMIDYYEARAAEYDDWYLRRGRYARGPVHDAAWHAELDAAGRWLDGLPLGGEIVELAAGTGWWSPLLASKGTLSLYDAAPATLDRARERLVAHGLRAHLHVRDVWAEPDRPVDAVFAGFWLSHVPDGRLAEFLGLVRRWLKPGGTFALIDSLPDPQSGAADHPPAAGGLARRRLDDGREFTIVKVHRPAPLLAAELQSAGFAGVEARTTGRFFVLASGRLG